MVLVRAQSDEEDVICQTRYINETASPPQTCEIGCYISFPGIACEACVQRTFNPSVNQTECQTCADGSTTLSKGLSECSLCQLGRGGKNGNCADCAAGRFADDLGGQCAKCGLGRFVLTICFNDVYRSQCFASPFGYNVLDELHCVAYDPFGNFKPPGTRTASARASATTARPVGTRFRPACTIAASVPRAGTLDQPTLIQSAPLAHEATTRRTLASRSAMRACLDATSTLRTPETRATLATEAGTHLATPRPAVRNAAPGTLPRRRHRLCATSVLLASTVLLDRWIASIASTAGAFLCCDELIAMASRCHRYASRRFFIVCVRGICVDAVANAVRASPSARNNVQLLRMMFYRGSTHDKRQVLSDRCFPQRNLHGLRRRAAPGCGGRDRV